MSNHLFNGGNAGPLGSGGIFLTYLSKAINTSVVQLFKTQAQEGVLEKLIKA